MNDYEIEKVSIETLLAEANNIEERTTESPQVKKKLGVFANELIAAYKDPITIVTDYDADGICSAFIIEKALRLINPQGDIEVICNDRRNGYGVPKDLEAVEGRTYVILDMGSNEKDYIYSKFGENTFIADHHIIDNSDTAFEFSNSANKRLLNLKTIEEIDGTYSDYCTTGLANRIYFVIGHIGEKNGLIKLSPEEVNIITNTVRVMSAIGTVADSVSLEDMHSLNRKIVKVGLDVIDKAAIKGIKSDYKELNYIEPQIGYLLSKSSASKDLGIDGHCTARDLGMIVAPVINAMSRMSNILNVNGAQIIYNALARPNYLPNGMPDTRDIDMAINARHLRRVYENRVKSKEFEEFIEEENNKPTNMALYRLPDDTDPSLCGIVASWITNMTSKAAIAVSFSKNENGEYIAKGSGRNSEYISSSIKAYLDTISSDLEGFIYGGHYDALGISRMSLKDFDTLAMRIESTSENLLDRKPVIKRLEVTPDELVSSDFLKRLEHYEPNSLPLAEIEGVATIKHNKFNPNSVTLELSTSMSSLKASITDDNYDENNYPFLPNGNIRVLTEIYPKTDTVKVDGTKLPVNSLKAVAVHDEAFHKKYRHDCFENAPMKLHSSPTNSIEK